MNGLGSKKIRFWRIKLFIVVSTAYVALVMTYAALSIIETRQSQPTQTPGLPVWLSGANVSSRELQ